jgi:DNA mismatch endonuclease (patch repair protein)
MDTVNPTQRSAIMRRVQSKNTTPEILVRRLIYRMGYRYRLHRSDLPGKPDLVFASRRKVIFVHGCFWHGHSGCRRARIPATNREYWIEKISKNALRDKSQLLTLRNEGWDALIVWECELRETGPLQEKLREFLDG